MHCQGRAKPPIEKPLHIYTLTDKIRNMFNRTNGRKGETLDATFSYPETQKENVSRIDSSSPRTAMITDQVEIKGTLAFDGSLEFNGIFEGEIISQGTLTIGSEAVIKAEIQAAKVIIRGKVQGNIIATESVEVCDKAELFGDVQTAKFIVAEAAVFRGRSDPIDGKSAAPEFAPVFRRLTPAPKSR
ncbi:MAG: polymer-forming cytoskeletal protein [Verrucomicrobia bacterium]|nr:polymer-forming cytoskeletal protein [Verrucomicrobiota bacterium]NBS79604.1 polymer-forming cytoskeletal protein [bacterium]